MTMGQQDERYERVIKFLKNAKPGSDSASETAEKVWKEICVKIIQRNNRPDLIDILFGWTCISWVRRSLVAASLFLVVMFAFQQGMIIRQINHLSRQIEIYQKDAPDITPEYKGKSMLLFSLPDDRLKVFRKDEKEKQLEQLLRSIDHLRVEYKNLHQVIESDPELKKLIEKRLSEVTDSKVKL